jgi:amidase
LKPTVGLVSNDLVLLSKRLGSVGPLTRRVKDAAAILNAIAGPCNLDPGTKAIPFDHMPDYVASCQINGLRSARIGVPRNGLRGNPPVAELMPAVEEAFYVALGVLRQCGATIVEDADYSEFDAALTSKCPNVIKSSDQKLRIAEYFGMLEENPSGVRSTEDLVHFTKTDPREQYPERQTRGLEKAVAATDDQESDEFRAALEYFEYIAHEGGVGGSLTRHNLDALILPTCVAPIMPAMGGYPMLSVPLGFYPENTPVKMNVRDELVERGPGMP